MIRYNLILSFRIFRAFIQSYFISVYFHISYGTLTISCNLYYLIRLN